jgi:peptidyl-prolyl cis-trans isomerase C
LNLACGGRASEDEELPPVVKFQIGESVLDDDVALVVDHAAGSDTLTAEAMQANLDRLNNLFPDIMSDPEQATAIRREIVRQFVLERALLAEAQTRGITADQSLVAQRIEGYRSQFPSEEAFEADLAERSVSRSEMQDQIASEVVRDRLLVDVGSEIADPDSAAVEAFRDKLAIRVTAQHILFLVEEDERAARVRKVAERVLDSARSGIDFAELARRHSEDPGSAMLGGELPPFRTGEMVQPFEEAAFALREPGEITEDLVRTAYGYHIIRLVDRARDALVDPDSAARLLRAQMERETRSDYMDSVLERTTVHLNPRFLPNDIVS